MSLYDDVMHCIKTRRSIRKFEETPLDDAHINALLEAAIWAPSGGNNQSWLFTAILNRDLLVKLNELLRQGLCRWTPDDDYPGKKRAVINARNETFNFLYHAPALIIASNVPEYQNGMADCALGLQNIFLAAKAMGLGSCWINQPRWLRDDIPLRAFLAELGLPREHIIYGAAAIGHPAIDPPAPKRKEGTTLIIR